MGAIASVMEESVCWYSEEASDINSYSESFDFAVIRDMECTKISMDGKMTCLACSVSTKELYHWCTISVEIQNNPLGDNTTRLVIDWNPLLALKIVDKLSEKLCQFQDTHRRKVFKHLSHDGCLFQ